MEHSVKLVKEEGTIISDVLSSRKVRRIEVNTKDFHAVWVPGISKVVQEINTCNIHLCDLQC